MKIYDLIAKSNQILKNKGIQSYILDTQLLLSHFLSKSKLFIITNGDYEVDNYDGFFRLVNRRALNEPMQYIIGKCEFMSLDFFVNENTLIPRPDTETLAEAAIDFINDKNMKFIDIGTGSGCIAISVLKYCKNATATALDISKGAIEVAIQNSRENGVDDRINFINMDILNDFPNEKFDVVLSNPPYIEKDIIPTLMKDVRNFEPHSALCGGEDGLDFYRRISEKSIDILNNNGLIAFEIGHNQSESVTQILKKDGYKNVTAICDLAGIKRVITAKLL